jgi:quinol monooxygenase YgiN
LILQLFEHWESAAALEAHFATPHFLAFSDVLLRTVDGTAEFTRYEVSSATPLFG